MTEWSLWVLDHGLPELPERVAVGESVPIARWVGPRFAAVMHVQWRWSDTHEDDGLSSETELFNRLGDAWEPADGSGGASWFDPPFCRPSSIGPRDALVFGGTGSFDDGRSCYSIEGIAGSEAAFVEVVDLDGTTRRPIECPFGAFIACSDGARVATLRVFDRDGDALLTTEFSTGLYGFPDPPR